MNGKNASRIRRMLAALTVTLMASACDGDMPSSPGSAIVLPNGDYLLTITLGALPPIGGSPTICMSMTLGPLSASAGFPVRLTGSGQGWTVRMPQPGGPGGGSLQMTLAASARTVTGTISGAARSADDAVTVTIPAPASFSGTERSSNTLGGQIEGETRLESAQNGLTCRSSTWTLAPR